MVRYTGRAKTQTGMSTNQVGLKMSGCPSRVGRKGTIIRKFNQRVNCMEGLCGGAKLNGKMWRTTYRNKEPFCKKRSTKCAQAAGGVGRINAPYFNRKVRAGESGCTPAAAPAGATGPAAAEVAAWDAVAAAEKVVEDAFQLKEEKKYIIILVYLLKRSVYTRALYSIPGAKRASSSRCATNKTD